MYISNQTKYVPQYRMISFVSRNALYERNILLEMLNSFDAVFNSKSMLSNIFLGRFCNFLMGYHVL